MNYRTLVYVAADKECVSFRTVSRLRKSPHRFYMSRSQLAQLEDRSVVVVSDIHSFAVLYRNSSTGIIEVHFYWLNCQGGNLSGYQETIALSYDKLKKFLQESGEKDSYTTWKSLSIDRSKKYPKLLFKSKKNLHDAMTNPLIRRKLARFLCETFRSFYGERIELSDDFVPYSFFFREIRNGEVAITGGLILHNQEDMRNAYYSMHT